RQVPRSRLSRRDPRNPDLDPRDPRGAVALDARDSRSGEPALDRDRRGHGRLHDRWWTSNPGTGGLRREALGPSCSRRPLIHRTQPPDCEEALTMHRRRFLGQVAGASAAIASTSFLAAGSISQAAPVAAGPKASVQYLTCDRRFIDARPCFDPTGTTVLFMRTPIEDQNQTWLYTIPAANARHVPHHCQPPDPFFVDPNLPATRPDWSWTRTSFEIAFAGNGNLHLLNTKTRTSLFVNCQPSGGVVLDTLSYPSWTHDGSAIVLTNYSEQALEHQQLIRVPVPPNPSAPFS